VIVFNVSKASCLGEQIEVADRSLDRMVGLLGRRTLAAGSGLLIVPSQAIHTFGMAFPIDVAFLDKNYKVLGTRVAVRPNRMTRVFWRAHSVLEVPAGTLAQTNTVQGDQLKLEWPERVSG
jgi:uncharacterized membrane protein (UPF0127 family)